MRRQVWAWDYPEPIRMPSGKAYVSRLTMFDSIGWGPHRCHWCEREIDWLPKGPGSLQVDHLDCDTSNDDLDNLTQSCARCNSARGKGVLWWILRYDERLQQRALDAGPVKRTFRCGHKFSIGNIYELGPKAHSRHVCLRCHREKARKYQRLQSA